MDYIEMAFSVQPGEPGKEILVAQLSEIGYESFLEKEDMIYAYIPHKAFDREKVLSVPVLHSDLFKISFRKKLVKHINWNAEWEKNFEPVKIQGKCLIRAVFHQVSGKFDYEIVIQPKMSFGTGHHETTSLMLTAILELGKKTFKNKIVLDAGCGSGILSILASKLNADQITAIDNDEWACRNARENISLNECVNILVKNGDAAVFGRKKFNIILANINKNFLLENIGSFSRLSADDGLLLVSGFYKNDLPAIKKEAGKHNLKLLDEKEKNHWSMAVFKKVIPEQT